MRIPALRLTLRKEQSERQWSGSRRGAHLIKPGTRLPLWGSRSAHNGPGVNDGFAPRYIDAVEDIDTSVEVGRVDFDALAQLDVVVALVPQQKAGFLARKLPELGCFDRTPSKTLPIPPSTQTYAAELSGLARLSSVVTRRTPRPEQECSVLYFGA